MDENAWMVLMSHDFYAASISASSEMLNNYQDDMQN
jgi:hypothetical protein